MKRNLLLDAKFLVMGAWVVLGIAGSLPFWNSFYRMGEVVKTKPFLREVGMWGADWEVYQYVLRSTPENSRILLLAPNSYFFSRLILFGYPRTLEFVNLPAKALAKKISLYDYIYVYIPMEGSSGVVPGLTGNITDWDVRNLVKLHNRLAPEEMVDTQEEMVAVIEASRGNLLYKVESIK